MSRHNVAGNRKLTVWEISLRVQNHLWSVSNFYVYLFRRPILEGGDTEHLVDSIRNFSFCVIRTFPLKCCDLMLLRYELGLPQSVCSLQEALLCG